MNRYLLSVACVMFFLCAYAQNDDFIDTGTQFIMRFQVPENVVDNGIEIVIEAGYILGIVLFVKEGEEEKTLVYKQALLFKTTAGARAEYDHATRVLTLYVPHGDKATFEQVPLSII